MTKLPYLPFFVGDFLSATCLWPGEARGLYALMLTMQWAGGPLPSDPAQLAGALNYNLDRLREHWSLVRPKFEATEAGLVNHRLEEHRAHAAEVSRKNSTSGRRGAASRWNRKDGERHSERHDGRHSERHNGCHQNANGETMASNPIQSRSKNYTGGGKAPPEWSLIKAAYPRRSGEQKWSAALKAAQKRVEEGATWEELLQGTERYAAYIRTSGSEGSQYVKQAVTFFGPQRSFAEAWDAPAATTRNGRAALSLIPLADEPAAA